MTSANIMFENSILQPNTRTVTKVMIVEDEAIVAEDLKDQLEEMSYNVCGIADNASDAISLAIETKPDVIMMDIVIKGEYDGIYAALEISQQLNIPVIFATAYSDSGTLARATKAAPYGYITKPYNAREARAAIEVALYKSTLEKQLKESEKWFSSTLCCVADGVIATDIHGMVRFLNPAAEHLVGAEMESIVGKSIFSIIRIEDKLTSSNPLLQLVGEQHQGSPRIYFGLHLYDINGVLKHVDFSMAQIKHDGKVIGSVVALRDIQERLNAEAALCESEERFRTAFEFAPIGMGLVSMDGVVMQTNQSLSTMIGTDATKANKSDLLFSDYVPTLELYKSDHALRQLLSEELPFVQFESRLKNSQGEWLDVHITTSLLKKNDIPVCYLHQIYDLTARKQYESQILHMAHYDMLTDLPNRAYLIEEIQRQMHLSNANNTTFALVFCDLDHFKEINDSMGHEAGDKFLKELSKEILMILRESDFIARLGGDEFVFLLSDISSETMAINVIKKIKNSLNKTIIVDNREIRIGASFGVCFYPGDGDDAQTLMKNADIALYQVKSSGRNNIQIYNQKTRNLGEDKVQLMTDLRNALDRQEFLMHYQPIINLSNGKVAAFEALIRWQHPSLGLVPPDKFLPYAEIAGLMPSIGEWLMDASMKACATWNQDRSERIPVTINIASSQLQQAHFFEQFLQTLKKSKLVSSDVILELTEHHFLSDTEIIMENIQKLKSLGIALAIDDFGTGYSSLSYVVRFTPSRVKIDRSFVDGINKDNYFGEMIDTILSITKKLPILAIAEGVETKEQLDFLRHKGCGFAQGYFFSKPIPYIEVISIINKQFKV